MDKFEVIIVGAGVVGLAIAFEASKRFSNVLLVEQHAQFGEETSSRNSEVIHAGIYYPQGSLKADLCVEGKELLYRFCQDYHVPYKQLGKLLLAHGEQEQEKLQALVQQAYKNGVDDLTPLTLKELRSREPNVSAKAAVLSPSTGIIDSHHLMLTLLGLFERNGGTYVGQTQFISAQKAQDGFVVQLQSMGDPIAIACERMVNTAGLHAQSVAKQIEGVIKESIPLLNLCKGSYFHYSGKAPFNHLVYPMPSQFGLGIHATLDLAGQVKFGPDTEFVNALDYRVDSEKLNVFVEAISRYFPTIDCSKLHPAYAGIRPKLQSPTSTFEDFVIQGVDQHNVKGLVSLFGIESPGLTSSLAIAKRVVAML